MSAHLLATPLSFPGAVEDVCDDSTGSLCSWVYDISDGNEFLASATTWFVDRPLRIIVVLVVAWIANRLLKRSVRKVVTHVITADRPERTKLCVVQGVSREDFQRLGIVAIQTAEAAACTTLSQ